MTEEQKQTELEELDAEMRLDEMLFNVACYRLFLGVDL